MLTLQKEYEAKFGPGDYIPPVKTTFWSFRIMVGAGMLMIFASMIGLYLSFRKNSKRTNGFYASW